MLYHRFILFFILVLTMFLQGCASHKATQSLPLQPPQQFSYSGTAEMPNRWWTAFEDEILDSLVVQGLDSNFNLLAVWERLQAAEAVVKRESSFLLPDLEAFVRSGLNFPEPDFVGGENVQLGLAAFYEIDLWGRIRSAVQAEGYRARASEADYRAAQISLSAAISQSWFRWLAARQQLAVINEQLENNEKMLQFIRAQFGSGQIRSVDILRQKQLVEASREQKIRAETSLEVLEHQLAVLLGEAPQQELLFPVDSFPVLPPLPATGLSTELLQRRPDVQQAFYQLQAADRELASAISSQYPRISLSSAVSVRANNAQDLFREWAYSLTANLVAPIFYGGRLSAEVNRTEAVKNQRLYEYGQRILVAFQEVEDALVQEVKQQESITTLEDQLRYSEQAYEQLRIEYFNGMSDYLAVLTAANQAQQLQRQLISARLNLLEFRIALYRALAGGITETEEDEQQL